MSVLSTPHSRRAFAKQAALFLAAGRFAWAAGEDTIAVTSAGKVRGTILGDVKIFRGIPYGADTGGKNRFMPPVKPQPWTVTRDALAYGPSAPQGDGHTSDREDCLVLNVFTPALSGGSKRPVMVWLHGGGFATGSGSGATIDGTSLAQNHDVVVVTINHRLNVFGFSYLGEQAGSDFALSGAAGMLDIVAALQWVRENIAGFGGDPDLVTIFGQSGGGRKVATLMSMPSAQGLYHRAIIESGAVLRLTTPEDAIHHTEMLLAELGLKQARDLQAVPVVRLLAANDAVLKKFPAREVGGVPNSPMIDGKALPRHPFDPDAPAISAKIPLLMGWAHTEETLYDRPTAESLKLDEAGLSQRARVRLGVDPAPVIAAFRSAYPDATPWDLHILIGTDHPRGAYSRELAKRKAAQGGASAWLYRFDWETPENGGHMRSPHTIEIPFVFQNIKVAGPLISKMPEAYTLAEKVSASWVAFARTGNPNTPQLPNWPAYSANSRETMIFNNQSRVVADPDSAARQAMEKVLQLA